MDYFPDFVYNVEDDKNICGFGMERRPGRRQCSTADLTPADVMGWLTGETLPIAVRFNHDCMENNPSHTICFPIVGACAKEITLPVAHMRTQKNSVMFS